MSCELKKQTFVIFKGESGERNDKYFTEKVKKNEEVKTITHIILARDSCEETRKYYNEPGIKFLKQQLEAETKGKKVDIIQKAMDYLAKTSGDFMEQPLIGPPKPKKKGDKDKEDEEKGEEKQNIFFEGKKIIVKDTKIELKKILITEIGESSYLGSGYEPRTSVMIKKSGDKNVQLVIDLEIAGEKPKITMKSRNEGEFIYFHCKSEKTIPNAPKTLLSTQSKMKNEIINFRFKIPAENLQIDKSSQKIEHFTKKNQYNGIVRVTYDIEEEDENPEEFDDL